MFDIEDLCQLLREELMNDLCVIAVPPELKYVDYMVIVSGRSTRQLRATAERIKWIVSKSHVVADVC